MISYLSVAQVTVNVLISLSLLYLGAEVLLIVSHDTVDEGECLRSPYLRMK